MRDSRHSLILGRGSARLEATHRIKPRDERVRYLLVAGCRRLGPRRLPDRSLFSGPRAITQRDRKARIRALARAGAMAVRHSHVMEVYTALRGGK